MDGVERILRSPLGSLSFARTLTEYLIHDRDSKSRTYRLTRELIP